MLRWWHFLHTGLGAVLLVGTTTLFVVFDVHSLWNYLVVVGFVAAGIVDLLAGVCLGLTSTHDG